MEFGHFLSAMSPFNLALALYSAWLLARSIGSIPGLTATMALAILVPITFSMEPASALILLGAIYTGAIYGGAYAAILLNTPGTPVGHRHDIRWLPYGQARVMETWRLRWRVLPRSAAGMIGAIRAALSGPATVQGGPRLRPD